MIEEQKIQEFLEELSSKQPTPGGGGASALGGALAAALGGMVSNLTIGKKKYMEVESDIREYLSKLEDLRGRFIYLAQKDAEVFAPLAASYSLPAKTPEEVKHKAEVMEENLLAASMAPIEVMEKSLDTLRLLKELGEKGSRLAVSDVGVGVQFARAALLGAAMNVYINTKAMKNREKALDINRNAQQLAQEGCKMAEQIYEQVLESLR